jgi:Icc-related predicted phosphoesterase
VSSIVFASDLHGNAEAYEALFKVDADAIVLGGDLLPYPLKRGGDLVEIQREFAVKFLAPLLDTRRCFWVLGNDDWEAMMPVLEGHGTSLHGRAVPFLDGLWIAGCSFVPVTPFGMKDYDRKDVDGWRPVQLPTRCLVTRSGRLEEITLDDVLARGTIEAELERLATLSDPARTVYVVHTPPYGTSLDRLRGITPIGSRALRRFIDARRPPLTLHGHLHESAGVERLGSTVSVNPGDSMRRLRYRRVDLRDFSVT